MNPLPENSRIASESFLKRIVIYAYDTVIKGMQKFLESGPPGRTKQQESLELFEWFQRLEKKDQLMTLKIIELTTKNTVLSFLVVLDNKVGGHPISSKSSDIAIYYQTYKNDNERFQYLPESQTRINMSYSIDGELHDKFNIMLQNRRDSP
jgi:hypothetical protein